MKVKNFEKITGLANMIYAISLIVVVALFYALLPVDKIATNYSLLVQEESWIYLNIFSMAALCLGTLGLIGIYIKQIKKSGIILFVGFILIMISLLMKAGLTSWEFITWPLLLKSYPNTPLLTQSLIYTDSRVLLFIAIFTLFSAAGYILFGIGSFKAKILPRWTSILLAIGGTAYAILLSVPPYGIIGLVLFSISIFSIGYFLVKNRE